MNCFIFSSTIYSLIWIQECFQSLWAYHRNNSKFPFLGFYPLWIKHVSLGTHVYFSLSLPFLSWNSKHFATLLILILLGFQRQYLCKDHWEQSLLVLLLFIWLYKNLRILHLACTGSDAHKAHKHPGTTFGIITFICSFARAHSHKHMHIHTLTQTNTHLHIHSHLDCFVKLIALQNILKQQSLCSS